jgi:titin
LLQNNYIGVDVSGTVALLNGNTGVTVSASNNTLIGGLTAAARNVISGNIGDGVRIQSNSLTNTVEGNYVGTDVTGRLALPNYGYGVALDVSANNNLVGGTAAGARNIISSNLRGGVLIANGSSNNQVQGNFIGTDVTGTTSTDAKKNILGNHGNGVTITSAAGNNLVGGTAAGAGNLISGNLSDGILLGTGATANQVQGNYVGTDVSGTTSTDSKGKTLGNHGSGVSLYGAFSNLIGGLVAAARNLISGNGVNGVILGQAGTTGNLVQGNYVGTDVTGTKALGNHANGVAITGAVSNTVGGSAAGAGNLISANTLDGVALYGAGTSNNMVQGNSIGTDVTGTKALGNHGNGVSLTQSAHNNLIGGTAAGAGNLIARNSGDGIRLASGASNNTLQGNTIRSNGANGVHVLNALTRNNLIGGALAGAGNTIVANSHDGVLIDAGTGNAIHQNVITGHASGLGIELINGGNLGQVAPVLTSGTSSGGSTVIQGTLDAAPLTQYTLEFFANTTCNPSGFGEGEQFVGSALVTTDASGHASFSVTFTVVVPPGQFLSATATSPAGNTSRFAQCLVVS